MEFYQKEIKLFDTHHDTTDSHRYNVMAQEIRDALWTYKSSV